MATRSWGIGLLETELLEEPLVLSGLVLLLKDLLDALASLLLLGGILNQVNGDAILQVDIQAVAGGHDMGEVDELDEGLDAGAALDLLSAHGLGDLQGGTVDTADEGGAELLANGLVVLFEG